MTKSLQEVPQQSHLSTSWWFAWPSYVLVGQSTLVYSFQRRFRVPFLLKAKLWLWGGFQVDRHFHSNSTCCSLRNIKNKKSTCKRQPLQTLNKKTFRESFILQNWGTILLQVVSLTSGEVGFLVHFLRSHFVAQRGTPHRVAFGCGSVPFQGAVQETNPRTLKPPWAPQGPYIFRGFYGK